MRTQARSSIGGVLEDPPRDESSSWSPPVPVWVLVGGLVVLSFVGRFLLALRDPAAWIFNDEIEYSELAQSLAHTGGFAIRDVPGTGGFGALYPTLIAPAFALFGSVPDAYDVVKAINALLMSLTIIPTYLLARRVAGAGWSLVAAAFSVAIPALMLTGTMMTENVFYPLVAFWLLAVVRALERPTVLRQVLVFVLLGLAFLTRAQAAVLAAVLVATLALVLLLDAWPPRGRPFLVRSWRAARAYWATWLLLGLGAVAAVVRQELRGQPLRDLLGGYAGVTTLGYETDEFGSWALYHLADANIFLGVFPVAAFLVLAIVGLRPAEDRSVRILAALGLSTVGALLAVVTAFASTPVADRILERNFFHVAPLFFVALAAWGAGTLGRRWWAVAPAALLAGTLTLALPLNQFLNGTIVHSTPGLLPIWRWRDRAFSPDSIDEVVAVAAIAAAALFVLLPRRFSPAMAVLLALYFAAATRPVESITHQASAGGFHSALGHPKDWVDRAVGRDADVSSVWIGGNDAFPFWETEIFNRSVGRAYTALGAYDGLIQTIRHGSLRPDGRFVDLDGRPVRLGYVVTDAATTLSGRRITSNGAERMTLFRIDGPVVVEERYDGLFPDRWSGASFLYRRYDCRGGRLRLALESSHAIHPRPLVVSVFQHGEQTGTLRFLPRDQFPRASVALRPRGQVCDLRLEIPTGSAEGSTAEDFRQLGLRFRSVNYEPSR